MYFVTSHNPQARLKSIGYMGRKAGIFIIIPRKPLVFGFRRCKIDFLAQKTGVSKFHKFAKLLFYKLPVDYEKLLVLGGFIEPIIFFSNLDKTMTVVLSKLRTTRSTVAQGGSFSGF